MPDGAATTASPVDLPGSDRVTLVTAGTVVVAAPDGSIDPTSSQGVFHRDLRVVSRLDLRIDGQRPRLLAQARTGTSTSEQALVVADGVHHPPRALVQRRRTVDGRVVDHVRVEVGADDDVSEFTVHLAVDLAPLAKDMVPGQPVPLVRDGPGSWIAQRGDAGLHVEVQGPAPELDGDLLRWDLRALPTRTIDLRLVLVPRWDGRAVTPPATLGESALEVVTGPRRLRRAVRSAHDDLRGLVVPWPEQGASFIAAGAPWFMGLFGRDSLFTAWESLVAGPELALDVLEVLARFQGSAVTPERLEEPGKILHELRIGGHDPFDTGGAAYYGSVDATPLFVMVLDEAHRFGADPERVTRLLPTARAAVSWCLGAGDLDGDGFVEYREDPSGLENQGWKDSGDAMVHADGSLAPDPIAGCEVQAYVYGALLALARLEERLGDPRGAVELRAGASELRSRFRAAFWLDEPGIVALALDGDKRPLAVPTSNMGHCLWTGILDQDLAGRLARRLLDADLSSPWGVRSLATGAAAYNPLGYHLGTVWPHDTAIVMAGLARAGFPDRARILADRLLAAAEAFDWRLPELLAGSAAGPMRGPIPYPVTCSPQAWSAAAPLVVLRTLLGLDPDLPAGVVRVDPRAARGMTLHVRGVGLGPATELRLDAGRVTLTGTRAEVVAHA